MAHKPKPFLKKGEGKYTKINYPVLRRSGVYQPPPDTCNSNREQRQEPVHNTTRKRETMPDHSFSLLSPRSHRSHRSPPFIPPLNIRAETGVMGQRSPTASEYSSDSPPRPKSFGSSLERRMGESDEGVVRDMNSSPGLPSGRPRTAGTIDSGFPREELAQLSPASSSGDTHASSFPSMVDDLTYLRPQRNGETDEVLVARRSPSHSPVTAPPSAPPVVNLSMNEEEVIVEPSLRSIPPAAKMRTLNADGSLIGNTTQEFERREQYALRRRRDAATPPTLYSSLASSTSSITDIRNDMRHLVKEVGEDKGEDPFFRMRPLENRVGGEGGRGLSTVREEVLGGLERPLPQRMMEQRLDESIASDAPLISPIGSQNKAKSVEVFDGASFRGSLDSRHESTSHFRIHSPSREEYAVAGDERRREERRQQPRHVLHPESQPVRRRSGDEESERSSGSTADARRFLIGDRRPLDDIRSGRSRGEITMTQQRPSNLRIRASQATLRHPPIGIPEESDESEGSPSYGVEEETMIIPSRGVNDRRGETNNAMNDREILRRQAQLTASIERVQMMEIQLRDAIAHMDMAEAALKREFEEVHNTSESNSRKMAYAYAEKEQKLQVERERIEQMKSELEKEKRLLRQNESSKVKEWMAKFEDEQKKYAEEKKKSGIETSKWRVREEKMKKENEELTVKVKSLETENERMRKLIEKSQRDRAVVRGNSAIRNAMTRAEDEAASGPLRNGLMRRRSSMNSLVDKENVHPPSSSSSFPSEIIDPPLGILKRNQVRFADTTYTVDPRDEPFYEINHGSWEWGPYSVYANNFGGMVTVTRPFCCCPCAVFKYGNGDLRFFNSNTSVVFHYFERNGAFRFDFPKQRCQVFYFEDGTLEIWRTQKEMTRCKANRGGNIDRTEVIKRSDGSYYAEIWNNNSMAIYDRRMGKGKSEEKFNPEVPRNGSTYRRESQFGKSDVVLHMSKNVEFFENNFYAVYYAATGNFKLVVNWKQSNEIKYELRPFRSCEIAHGKEGNEKACISFGPKHRTKINEV